MFSFLLCAIFLFSCEKSDLLFAPQEPAAVIQAGQADEHIAQIAKDAQDTLPAFFRHLTRADSQEHHFCIKYPFMADYDSGLDREQVWLTNIRFKNGTYYGTLANSPLHLHGMKKGDTVAFDTDKVTDWMYIRDGNIVGGYSIPCLLETIPADQRSPGEQSLLIMFE